MTAETRVATREDRRGPRCLIECVEDGALSRVMCNQLEYRGAAHVADDDAVVEEDRAGIGGTRQLTLHTRFREHQHL
jgi:hypothetical protein